MEGGMTGEEANGGAGGKSCHIPKERAERQKEGKEKKSVLEDLELDFVRLVSEKDQSSLKPSACFEVLFL